MKSESRTRKAYVALINAELRIGIAHDTLPDDDFVKFSGYVVMMIKFVSNIPRPPV